MRCGSTERYAPSKSPRLLMRRGCRLLSVVHRANAASNGPTTQEGSRRLSGMRRPQGPRVWSTKPDARTSIGHDVVNSLWVLVTKVASSLATVASGGAAAASRRSPPGARCPCTSETPYTLSRRPPPAVAAPGCGWYWSSSSSPPPPPTP